MPDSIFSPDERPAATAARLALALDAAGLGDWSWEAKTDLVRLSPRGAEILGLPPSQPITWTDMRQILHPDDREPARLAVERAIETRTDYDIQYRIQRGSAERWVHARGRAMFRDDDLLGMLGVVADVSDLRSVHASVTERGALLQELHDVGLTIAGERDQERLIQAVTDAATRMSRAEFGAFFYNVVGANGASYMLYTLSGVSRAHFERFPMPRATPMFAPTFEGQGTIRLGNVTNDVRYGQWPPFHGMPPGHLPVCSYLAVPVVSRGGRVLGGLFFGHSKPDIFTEVAERAVEGLAAHAAVALDNAQLLQQASTATAQAERANRLKDEFLATLSHELRTPLNAVLGWAHLLRSGTLDSNMQSQAIETIERNARAQARIIDDILDVSRIITGKLRLNIETVNLEDIVKSAIESVEPTASAKQIRISRRADSAAAVSGDASRIQQVMWNLLTNAIKFTPRGGRVDVDLRRTDSKVVIAVTDNGEGIEPTMLRHVFERFRQEDSSSTRTHQGLGLGLAIVRHIVELHGGTVHAESEGKGMGAKFSVALPVSAVRTVSIVGEASASAPITPAASDVKPGSDLDGTRILVVDDDLASRELLFAILGGAGAAVDTAGSVESALGHLGAARYDLVISDLGMPNEDGYVLIQRIRAWPAERGGRTPAIALTAYARAEDRVRCLESGFQTHLAKPIHPPELLVTVRAVLNRT